MILPAHWYRHGHARSFFAFLVHGQLRQPSLFPRIRTVPKTVHFLFFIPWQNRSTGNEIEKVENIKIINHFCTGDEKVRKEKQLKKKQKTLAKTIKANREKSRKRDLHLKAATAVIKKQLPEKPKSKKLSWSQRQRLKKKTQKVEDYIQRQDSIVLAKKKKAEEAIKQREQKKEAKEQIKLKKREEKIATLEAAGEKKPTKSQKRNI